MNKKIGRNDHCPCGSGIKYKKCCLGKHDDEEFSNPVNFLNSFKTLRKESKIKQCLHPDRPACSEKIIGAHSIQNNKILKRLSSNGHVYMPCPKPDNPFAVMTKWGRKEATVFTGFCGHHDNKVFDPIEDGLFDGSELHIFLYTYRCFAVEYHKKMEVVNMQKNAFRRKPSLIGISGDEDPFGGMLMSIDDFQPVKSLFDKSLLTAQYNILSSVVWEMPFPINFAASGFEAPTTDLQGNKLQNLLDVRTLAKHTFVIVFSEENKTYCIFSWLKDNDELFFGYRQQLEALDQQQRQNYINNTLPIISENIALNPESWDRMEQSKKDEFGMLLWGMAELSELSGHSYNRLETPTFDLFSL
ncbi:SEC-C metal-binding domain-containing protein [Paenibacillus sp. MER TA 81-3]|uniref:YecA family protein n=1 Tax=Paenibacillus sp. MER TA 81-3 TaxID=2939573 RepID=UPI00203CC569|nr:SEC-C metal-binding domain-containing protein [Paenibacillus sp. MER TA 81-3]MCM3342517.1 SEC-C metal-binding domain-containing protein [Paenibacillus sp. MER TA 81-3]